MTQRNRQRSTAKYVTLWKITRRCAHKSDTMQHLNETWRKETRNMTLWKPYVSRRKYVTTVSGIAKNYGTLRKLSNVVVYKRDAAQYLNKTWRNETRCVTLRKRYFVRRKIRDVATALTLLHGFQNVGHHGLESMASLLGVCNIPSHRVGGSECDVTRNSR